MEFKKILPMLIIALLMLFIVRNCIDQSQQELDVEVDIPEVNKKFESFDILHKDLFPFKIIDTLEVEKKVENPYNLKLKKEYDSLLLKYRNLENEKQRIDFVSDMIMFRQFNKVFEDDYFLANVSGTVRGELKNLELDITSKSRTLNTKVKVPNKNILLVGGGMGFNFVELKPSFKADINLLTKKDNLWTISADSQEYFYISHSFKVFKF